MNMLRAIEARREKILKAYPHVSKQVAAIRKNSVNNLAKLLSQTREALKGKGCHVYLADRGEDAQQTIKNLLSGQEKVVRTYSNALREISFDALLGEAGIRVFKSHMGEIIAEITAGQSASATGRHPFLPHIDLSREVVTQALQKFLNTEGNSAAEELNKAAHRKIKENILQCEFGVTGSNGIAAENGTLIIAEDEGNCRAVSNLPYRHLAVVGIEKIAYSVEDSLKTLECQCIYGLGKAAPTYYSLISGPSRTGDIECRITFGMHGPKEVHVVLLDSGRLNLVDQGFGDVLKCIDCGACFETIAPIAETSGWVGVSLTPKGIALGIVQGKLPKPKEALTIPAFTCPVGIDGVRLGKILPQIRSLT
jgi:L-lactate dehydrogenase complex protein LldG